MKLLNFGPDYSRHYTFKGGGLRAMYDCEEACEYMRRTLPLLIGADATEKMVKEEWERFNQAKDTGCFG